MAVEMGDESGRRKTAFALDLGTMISRRGMSQTRLAREMDVSPAYVSALVCGMKAVSAEQVDRISDVIAAGPDERVRLHRAAARDLGFRLDLPDDF